MMKSYIKVILRCILTHTHMWLDCKNHPKSHKNWNLIYCWTLNLYSCSTYRNTKHTAIDGQVLFHRWLFPDPVKLLKCTTGSVEPVSGINKDIVVPYCCQWLSWPILRIESVSVTYWRHSTAVHLLMEGITRLWLTTHPHHTPPTRPLLHTTCDILQLLWKNLLEIQQC